MRLTRAVFKYIETELFHYDDTRKELNAERDDIIAAAPVKAEGSRGSVPDPTAAKASRLLTSVSISQMERTVRAVERALARLNDDHRQLFELHYRKVLSWQEVCGHMHIGKTKFYDTRNALVKMVAVHMGYEVNTPRKSAEKVRNPEG